jgi:hypothetical protein
MLANNGRDRDDVIDLRRMLQAKNQTDAEDSKGAE